MQVEDRARRLDGVSDRGGTRGQPLVQESLVLVYEPLQLPLLRGDRVQLLDVELPEALNVYWPPILWTTSVSSCHVALTMLALSILW